MIIQEADYIAHYGILRRSGRYPWGSGGNVETRSRSFLDFLQEHKDAGMKETEVARLYDMTTTELRAARTIARNEYKQGQINMAARLKDRGWSNTAIAERMGRNESYVRTLLVPAAQDKLDISRATVDMLRDQVDAKGFLDVGSGVSNHIGISDTKLNAALAQLKQEGYEVHGVKVDQVGTGHQTDFRVLTLPGNTQRDVWDNRLNIQTITETSDDGGRTFFGIKEPMALDPNRVAVRYAEEGGTEADGVMYIRPGVDDLSLGGSSYAQVRIAVGDDKYLKGMAIYKDDLPDGVDVLFNTNKSDTGNKLDALKEQTGDPDNPFGSMIKRQVLDDKGDVTSVMNIVNEEGDWDDWSRNLASQMLSKQAPSLVRQQLDVTYENRKKELDEINSLTNDAVRKKLLAEYAEGADTAAIHLKAAALPRQATQVILPISDLPDTEIYAPNFRDGERVALVRFPHGGTFEIPELTVNNNHPNAKGILGNAKDAVGINASVAERLSGADFDGDTVLVIPNNSGKVKSRPALEGLKDFDPRSSYPAYEGMKRMSEDTKQMQMGLVSNLITDMTIQKASDGEIARAVRHSMVVIDGAKHNLDYKQSEADNGIRALREKYQGGPNAGASTLISRSGTNSTVRVAERRDRKISEGGPIDPDTGERVYVETGRTRTAKDGSTVPATTAVPRLSTVRDANELSSGTKTERLYADHSNKMKALANDARKAQVAIKPQTYSPSAKKVYKNEVASLDSKLDLAIRNRPLERQAQVVANAIVKQKRQAKPNMTDDELKKVRSQALTEARTRTGARKQAIEITSDEWSAIQAGAISNNKLTQILDNSNMETVRKLAMPRPQRLMTDAKTKRAASMLNSGYTRAEVADALGVSLTTLDEGLL